MPALRSHNSPRRKGKRKRKGKERKEQGERPIYIQPLLGPSLAHSCSSEMPVLPRYARSSTSKSLAEVLLARPCLPDMVLEPLPALPGGVRARALVPATRRLPSLSKNSVVNKAKEEERKTFWPSHAKARYSSIHSASSGAGSSSIPTCIPPLPDAGGLGGVSSGGGVRPVAWVGGRRPPPFCCLSGFTLLRADISLREVGAATVSAFGRDAIACLALRHATGSATASSFIHYLTNVDVMRAGGIIFWDA